MKQIFKFSIIASIILLLSPLTVQSQNSISSQIIDNLTEKITEHIEPSDSIVTSSTEIESQSQSNELNGELKRVEEAHDYKLKRMEASHEYMISALAIICTIGLPIALFFIVTIIFIIYIYKRRTLKYRIINKAIDNGITLPDSFYNEQDINKPKNSRLHSALVWIACGLGISCFFFFADAGEAVAIGFAPIFVGIAKLITYFVEDRKKESQDVEQN